MKLRASQIETLRAVPKFDGEESTAAHTGAYTCRTLIGERRVLRGLEDAGYVKRTGKWLADRGLPFYRLTPKGREALEEREARG